MGNSFSNPFKRHRLSEQSSSDPTDVNTKEQSWSVDHVTRPPKNKGGKGGILPSKRLQQLRRAGGVNIPPENFSGTSEVPKYSRSDATLTTYNETNDALMQQKIVIERKTRIEKYLNTLPEQENRPKLKGYENLLWQLYIDADRQDEAMEKYPNNPGELFDHDQEKGYQASMENAFKTISARIETSQQVDLNYEGYRKLHQLVTEFIEPAEVRELMRRSNGISNDHPQQFTFSTLAPIPKDGPERLERLAALEEMRNKFINELPLFIDHPKFDAKKQQWLINTHKFTLSLNTHWFLYDIAKFQVGNTPVFGYDAPYARNPSSKDTIMQKLWIDDDPQGIIMGITSSFDGTVAMLPLYSQSEGQKHVNTILKSYYEGRKVAGQNAYQRLGEIADTVDMLTVVHEPFDGNGRFAFAYLNQLLLEEDFCPTKLPNPQELFGGRKTRDGKVEEILFPGRF